jgi:DNA-binding transcriptional ArsR family regulator
LKGGDRLLYVKSIIKLLAGRPGLSIYAIARKLEAGPSSIYYPLKRLKDVGAVTESNKLTDNGRRLSKLIEVTEHEWVRKEDCARRFGLDALKIGKQLGIIYEKANVVVVKEIKDPSPREIFVVKRESNASQLAARAFTIAKRVAWNRPLVADILQRRPIRTWLKSRHTILLKEPILAR